MNPGWLTGSMPEGMYAHERPEHLDEARAEERALYEKRMRQIGASGYLMSENREVTKDETTDGKNVD